MKEHKIVHVIYSLRMGEPSHEESIEMKLNELSREGWEAVSCSIRGTTATLLVSRDLRLSNLK